ncbi:hypothetical protein [Fischerella thermalis]|uniref:Uncharacterized protein n=1 Tax=Fischerella thermalis CCMEE 5318 TaxID=2019666 RepID=A0A2N6L4U5_9CYAN|nr:hypothetical protein [Fischerella thermalis]PMB16297.1 hypothetical protein CEN46_25045 [Fischerella thermalis CCMEE 5318]
MATATMTELKSFQQVATFDRQVCELKDLTKEDDLERLRLEQKVDSALEKNAKLYFYYAGKALSKLLEQKLYRSSHPSFDEYCLERFRLGRSQVYRYIHAASTYDNLRFPNGFGEIFPTAERQIRDLYNLEPQLQREVWQTATDLAAGQPSSRIVKEALLQVLIKYGKVQNPYSIGEVCQIIAKSNPQLKDKNGCWCIVKKIDASSCTCTVATMYGQCTITVDHLKSLNYSDTERELRQQLCDRLNKLYNRGNLEEAAISVLKQLGRIQRPYLLPLEENLLRTLEQS